MLWYEKEIGDFESHGRRGYAQFQEGQTTMQRLRERRRILATISFTSYFPSMHMFSCSVFRLIKESVEFGGVVVSNSFIRILSPVSVPASPGAEQPSRSALTLQSFPQLLSLKLMENGITHGQYCIEGFVKARHQQRRLDVP